MELIHTVFDALRVHLKGPLTVKELPFTAANEASMRHYAEEPSNFDGDQFRGSLWRDPAAERRHYQLADFHTLLTVGHKAPSAKLLGVMAGVLAAMGSGKHYTIYWFMSDEPRLFPSGRVVGPLNVNGGYCRACAPETIVIYRREDALRVLIHELQHACCLDDHKMSVPQLEAITEAWAELIYAMVGAVVHRLRPEVAWRIQTAWSAAQNRRLSAEFGVTGPAAYAWRHTVGKEEVWRAMNLPVAPPAQVTGPCKGPLSVGLFPTVTESLQLGAPQLDVA